MDRNDFIETREDIVQNIKTLYSYLDGKVDSEHKDWAIQRMSQGKNYVIEVVDSQIYFAPSRFVGYVDTRWKSIKPTLAMAPRLTTR
ncbi:MAG: hypothetical protein PUB38_06880 [Prevotella sp.]|nr:hypothetical protein [Prevotella sp.]